MKEEKAMEYAGDLLQEMNEIRNVIPENDGIEFALSHTYGCSTLLTIYCC